jgi:GlpG protein
MRLIGHLDNENDARRLTHFLKTKGIETNCDGAFDGMTGHMSYSIWVYDEDKWDDAQKEFAQFARKPTDASYDMPTIEPVSSEGASAIREEKTVSRDIAVPFTLFIIALCSLVFFLNWMQEAGTPERSMEITPIQEALFFDFPQGIDVENLESTPFWKGAYEWILLKMKGEPTVLVEGPMFTRILQGEVWRAFSPAILHTEVLHILFNMIWVWVLCRPIEQKIGIFRLIFLTLIVAIGSNVAQYLMSGPFFLGYSGVVMGLAGFTWMRERIAPWEGYPLHRSTVLFLLLFVGGMFLLQAASFGLEIFTNIGFSPRIANTAHIVGALIGAFLARFSLFAERVIR